MDYHLKPGYVERPEPKYWLDESSDVVWQPDVYLEAAVLAERLGAKRIVDVGCGNAEKVAALRDRFEIIGVDFGPNIESCRKRHDWGEWVEADLNDDGPLALPAAHGAVVICADVIEHVLRPEQLLRKLRDLLDRDALALLLSTPERDLRRGRAHAGPSPNPAHVREWALDELQRFMAAERLIGSFGLTRTNDREPFLHTIFAAVPGPTLDAQQTTFETWWSYRRRWEDVALEHEAALRALQSHPLIRIDRRAKRLARSILGTLR